MLLQQPMSLHHQLRTLWLVLDRVDVLRYSMVKPGWNISADDLCDSDST